MKDFRLKDAEVTRLWHIYLKFKWISRDEFEYMAMLVQSALLEKIQ